MSKLLTWFVNQILETPKIFISTSVFRFLCEEIADFTAWPFRLLSKNKKKQNTNGLPGNVWSAQSGNHGNSVVNKLHLLTIRFWLKTTLSLKHLVHVSLYLVPRSKLLHLIFCSRNMSSKQLNCKFNQNWKLRLIHPNLIWRTGTDTIRNKLERHLKCTN